MEEVFQPQRAGAAAAGSGLPTYSSARPVPYSDIEPQDDARRSSGIDEFDRVLGGGIVAGSLVLIGGDPGIGKSTIIIQIADHLSARGGKVLYVSGEESERQIKMRGERLGLSAENLVILPETNLEAILAETEKTSPAYLIVDSIQTVFSSNLDSAPGSISQVREAAGEFMLHAKRTATGFVTPGAVSTTDEPSIRASALTKPPSSASIISNQVSACPSRLARPPAVSSKVTRKAFAPRASVLNVGPEHAMSFWL